MPARLRGELRLQGHLDVALGQHAAEHFDQGRRRVGAHRRGEPPHLGAQCLRVTDGQLEEACFPATGEIIVGASGAMLAIAMIAVTLSGSCAPTARACGPPEEWPATTNRSRPRSSATASTSPTTSTI